MIRKTDDMRVEVREDMRGGSGAVSIRHCFEKEEITANVRLCSLLTLPPGTSIGPHRHENEDEIFIVTAGMGVLDDGVAETEIQTGDAILTGKGESHAVRNTGDRDLEIVAMIVCY